MTDQIPIPCEPNTNDPDLNYDTDAASALVQNELEQSSETKPKKAYQTISFWTMVASSLAGLIVMVMVSKGIIVEGQRQEAINIPQPLIMAIIGWIIVTYIKGRNRITEIKALAASQIQVEKVRQMSRA